MSRPRLLLLAPGEHSWRLDEQTRQRGKAGVKRARAALAQALAEELRAGGDSHGQHTSDRRRDAA